MAQSTQERPEVSNDPQVSKFSARVSTDDFGRGFLDASVERTFRSSEELRRWLYACADQLALDIKKQGRVA